MFEKLRQEFQGGADELVRTAQEVAAKMKLPQEGSEGNERLLRHYVSLGVVDKPIRDGREAMYGFRQLAQYLVARRLLTDGFALAKIARFTSVVTTDELAKYLEKTDSTSEAELLVAAFRAEGVASDRTQAPRRQGAIKPLPTVPAGMGMVDVLQELREMEDRFQQRMNGLKREVNDLVSVAQQASVRQDAGARIDPSGIQVSISRLEDTMDEAVSRFGKLLEKPLAMIQKQIEQQEFLLKESSRTRDFLDDVFRKMGHEQRDFIMNAAASSVSELHRGFDQQKAMNLELLNRLEKINVVVEDLRR
ncbi:MAG: hypothetical protein WBI20_15125 [Burkholderiaceae bacterium]